MIRPPPGPPLFPSTPLSRSAATAVGQDRPVEVRTGRADPHALPVVGEDLQTAYVRGGGAAPLGRRPAGGVADHPADRAVVVGRDRKSTRLNSSHLVISYAVF